MGIETYASPGLRWGLLLEDHPGATHNFEIKTGTELGVPEGYGGKGNFCVCTIHIPGHEPVTAYKAVKDRGQPDEWTVNCTKTLGRALKKCGYPDDLKDLKALVLWRQRDAEIAAIRGGVAIASSPKPLEIEAGGRDADDDGEPDTDHDVIDEADTTTHDAADSRGYETDANSGDDTIVDAEVVEDGGEDNHAEVDAARWEALVTEVEGLKGNDAKDFADFLRTQDIPADPNEWTNDDLTEIDGWFES